MSKADRWRLRAGDLTLEHELTEPGCHGNAFARAWGARWRGRRACAKVLGGGRGALAADGSFLFVLCAWFDTMERCAPRGARHYGFVETKSGEIVLVRDWFAGRALDALRAERRWSRWQTACVVANLVGALSVHEPVLQLTADMSSGRPVFPEPSAHVLAPADVFVDDQLRVCLDLMPPVPRTHTVERHSTRGDAARALLWMCPQMIRRRVTHVQIHVWAAGLLAWEVAAGTRVFLDLNPIQVATRVAYEQLRPSRFAHAPPGVNGLVERCTEFQFHERPKLRELRSLLDWRWPFVELCLGLRTLALPVLVVVQIADFALWASGPAHAMWDVAKLIHLTAL